MDKPIEKPARTLEQINEEYTRLCQVIGEKTYQMELFKSQIQSISQRLFAINQEAEALRKPPLSAVPTEAPQGVPV